MRRKYKIKFKKTMRDIKYSGTSINAIRTWKEINNSEIIKTLEALNSLYHFSILSVNLEDATSGKDCCIVIKCSTKDIQHVFFDFCKDLEGYINNISLK